MTGRRRTSKLVRQQLVLVALLGVVGLAALGLAFLGLLHAFSDIGATGNSTPAVVASGIDPWITATALFGIGAFLAAAIILVVTIVQIIVKRSSAGRA